MLLFLKSRLITLIFVAFCAGIWTAFSGLTILAGLLIALPFLLFVSFSFVRQKELFLILIILATSFLAGAEAFWFKKISFKNFQKQFKPGESVQLTGLILEEPQKKFESYSFPLKLDNTIVINCSNRQPLIAEPGDRARVSGYFSKLPENIREKIYFYLEKPPIKIRAPDSWFLKAVWKIRKNLLAVSHRGLPPADAEILNSLVLGDTAAPVPEKIKEIFTRCGLIHLLVASGTQIAILIGAISWSLQFLRLSNWLKTILIFCSSFIISLLTGFGPSIQRAMFMAQLASLGSLLGRENDGLNLLAAAGLLILIFSPLSLFDVGFQLSFAASFSLVYLLPIWQVPGKGFTAGIKNSLLLSVLPVAVTAPIIACYFNRLSLVAIPANLLVLPWIEFLIILAAGTIFLGSQLSILSRLLWALNLAGLKILLLMAKFFSDLPAASIFIPSPGIFLIIIFYGWLLSLSLAKKSKQPEQKKVWRAATAALICLLLILGIFSRTADFFSGHSAVFKFLDVGEGDATFIKSPTGRNILIDTGGPSEINHNYQESNFKDTRVLRHLSRMGINKIDLLIISHPDSDHLGGFPAIADNLIIKTVTDSGLASSSTLYQKFQEILKNKKIPELILSAGDQITVEPDFKIISLYPFGQQNDLKTHKNQSLVAEVIYKNFRILFTGDLEKEAEDELISKPLNLKINLLKVAHHGSKTSSSEEFLNRVQPQVAIISVGKKNRFGHPHPEILARLKKHKIKIWRTDENGNITVKSNGTRYQIYTEKYHGRCRD